MSERKPALTRRLQRDYLQIIHRSHNAYHDMWIWWQHGNPGHQASVAWAAYYFAKRWHGRDIDMKRLQKIVLDWGTAECLYKYARDVPGVNLRRFAIAVAKSGNADVMKLFVKNIPGIRDCDERFLTGMALINEVMAL